jgi:hypothetical protein
VYHREVAGKVLTFRTTGQTWNKNMVMEDMQTHSLWMQMLGLGKRGPLQGQHVRVLPATRTTWTSWLKAHPDTTVLIRPLTVAGKNNSWYLTRDSMHAAGNRLLWGLDDGKHAAAWTLGYLRKNAPINAQLGNVPVLITFSAQEVEAHAFRRQIRGHGLEFGIRNGRLLDRQTRTTWDPRTGHALDGRLQGKALDELPGISAKVADWHALHPDAPVVGWRPKPGTSGR